MITLIVFTSYLNVISKSVLHQNDFSKNGFESIAIPGQEGQRRKGKNGNPF